MIQFLTLSLLVSFFLVSCTFPGYSPSLKTEETTNSVDLIIQESTGATNVEPIVPEATVTNIPAIPESTGVTAPDLGESTPPIDPTSNVVTPMNTETDNTGDSSKIE